MTKEGLRAMTEGAMTGEAVSGLPHRPEIKVTVVKDALTEETTQITEAVETMVTMSGHARGKEALTVSGQEIIITRSFEETTTEAEILRETIQTGLKPREEPLQLSLHSLKTRAVMAETATTMIRPRSMRKIL